MARLENYPDRFIAKTAMITYLDPCLAPFDIQASTLYEQAGSYRYTGAPFTYVSPDINAVPYWCPVEYECSELGTSTLPCDSAGIASFDALTHTWTLTLTTDDYSTYPPGNYYFEISGKAGGQVPMAITTTFVVKLIDLCIADVAFNLTPQTIPVMQYMLEGPEMSMTLTMADLYALDPPLDCGPVEITFYDNLQDFTYNSIVFRWVESPPSFITTEFFINQQND